MYFYFENLLFLHKDFFLIFLNTIWNAASGYKKKVSRAILHKLCESYINILSY